MHESKLTAKLNKILSQTDLLPLHPKYKILLYSRHLLSKISWHFTVVDLTKTRVSENLDNTVAFYIRRYFFSCFLDMILPVQNIININS